jgi:hypothetical protein
MRALLLLLTASLALSGCEDAIGLGGSCRAEMREVQRAEGSPDRTDRREDRPGDFSEQWIYLAAPGRSGRVYTFRWGVSFQSCQLSGPSSLGVVPAPETGPLWIILAEGER